MCLRHGWDPAQKFPKLESVYAGIMNDDEFLAYQPKKAQLITLEEQSLVALSPLTEQFIIARVLFSFLFDNGGRVNEILKCKQSHCIFVPPSARNKFV